MDEDRRESVTVWAPWFRYFVGLVVIGLFAAAFIRELATGIVRVSTPLYALVGIIVGAIFGPALKAKVKPRDKGDQ